MYDNAWPPPCVFMMSLPTLAASSQSIKTKLGKYMEKNEASKQFD